MVEKKKLTVFTQRVDHDLRVGGLRLPAAFCGGGPHLDTNAILIHMFLTVPRFHRDPVRIQQELGISSEAFRLGLVRIERAGLIRGQGDELEVITDTLHLPATSPLYPAHRAAMRFAALNRMQTQDRGESYSFSTLYSAGDDSRPKIQARFLEFVEWAQALTQGSPTEHVYQINFDLLKWSKD